MDTIQNIEENNLNTEGVKTKKEKKSFNFKLHLRIILAIGMFGLIATLMYYFFIYINGSGPGDTLNINLSIFYFLHSILAILAFIFLKFKKKIGFYFLVTFYLLFIISILVTNDFLIDFSSKIIFLHTIMLTMFALVISFPAIFFESFEFGLLPLFFGGISSFIFLVLSFYELFFILRWKSFLINKKEAQNTILELEK